VRERAEAQEIGGKTALIWQRVEDNAFHLRSQECALSGCSQIAKRIFRQLEFVPVVVDFCSQPFVELAATLIPFRDPPLDHPAAGLRRFLGYSFHQESAGASASVSTGDIKLLDNEVRFRSIREGNEVIHKKSNQFAAFLCDETMKIGRRTTESLFAQHLFRNSEVFCVFLKLGDAATALPFPKKFRRAMDFRRKALVHRAIERCLLEHFAMRMILWQRNMNF
jgi:hypothetical protein